MPTKAPGDSEQLRKKAAVVDEIATRLRDADAAVLTEYRGLTVTDLANLRAALRPAATEYKIFKNTLARRAAEEAGMTDVAALLEGPVAIAFVRRDGDAVTAAKALRDFARTNPNLVVKGGLLGPRVMTRGDIEALADVPPREQLLARLAGGFQAPLTKAAGLFQAFTRNFAYGIKAYIDTREPDQQDEAPAAEAAPEPAAEATPEPAPEVAAPEPAAEAESAPEPDQENS
ncbi:MAG: large subunit ribosomal protein [Actinomycetota bacterium]|jgi:large subunit ribosomal protein L10|nr:large subunit ribosomal protein [Actinomycetota bacterium]